MPSTHFINGVDCDAADRRYILASADDPFPSIPAVEYSSFRLPGRYGVVPVYDPAPGPGGYVMRWRVEAADIKAADKVRDELMSLVQPTPGRPITIRRVMSDTREAQALLRNAEVKEDAGRRLYVSAAFEIPSGMWRAPSTSQLTVGSGATVSAAAISGSAPIFDPTFTFASANAVRLTDNLSGSWIAVGSGTSGTVTVDVGAMTARAGATNHDAKLDFGPIPFRITPGGTLTATGAAVTVTARKAWW